MWCLVPQSYQNQHNYEQRKEKYAQKQYSSFDSFLFNPAVMVFNRFCLFCIFCKNSVLLRMKHFLVMILNSLMKIECLLCELCKPFISSQFSHRKHYGVVIVGVKALTCVNCVKYCVNHFVCVSQDNAQNNVDSIGAPHEDGRRLGEYPKWINFNVCTGRYLHSEILSFVYCNDRIFGQNIWMINIWSTT